MCNNEQNVVAKLSDETLANVSGGAGNESAKGTFKCADCGNVFSGTNVCPVCGKMIIAELSSLDMGLGGGTRFG